MNEEKPALHKDNKQAGIPAKLAWIVGQMERIPKLGHNVQQNYDFAREADIVDFVRPYLAVQNLALLWDTKRYDLHEIKSSTGRSLMYCDVLLVLTAHDGDSSATLPLGHFPGMAIDAGDKAVTKALTSAKKYAYMLTFHISTGEDLEDDRDPDKAKGKPPPGGEASPKVTRIPRRRATGADVPGEPPPAVDPERQRVYGKIFALMGEYALLSDSGRELQEEFRDKDKRHSHDILQRMYGKRSLHQLTPDDLHDFIGKLEFRIREASEGMVTP